MTRPPGAGSALPVREPPTAGMAPAMHRVTMRRLTDQNGTNWFCLELGTADVLFPLADGAAGQVRVRCACHMAAVDLALPADWYLMTSEELLIRIKASLDRRTSRPDDRHRSSDVRP